MFCAALVLLARWSQADHRPIGDLEVPIQFREGLIWLAVDLPLSGGKLNFLLDSGSSANVVSIETVRRLGLPLGGRVNVAGVGKTVTGYWPVQMTTSLGGLRLPGDFLALDLKKLSKACQRPVDGLVGADFFRGRVVEIDYEEQRLRILNGLSPSDKNHFIPLESGPCGFCVAVSVNGGRRQPVRVDTGCATALQWVIQGAQTRPRHGTQAVGLSDLSIPQTMTSVRVGDRCFDTVPTGLHSKSIFPGEAGLLGNGFLAQFGAVAFDAGSGRLRLGRVGTP